MKIKNISLMIILSLLLLLEFNCFESVAQITVIVPNSYEDMSGNNGQLLPFACASIGLLSQRYQALYSGNQIGVDGIITKMNFRLSQVTPSGFDTTIPDIVISMSITSVQPGGMSTTFADNLGPIVQTVYSGPLNISAPDCDADPCPFDLMVPLQIPFQYNRSLGNLLVDYKVNTCVTASSLDTPDGPQNAIERVFTSIPDGVNSPTGNIASNQGVLITQFVIERISNVPTLSEWSLMTLAGILGIVGFMVIRRMKAVA